MAFTKRSTIPLNVVSEMPAWLEKSADRTKDTDTNNSTDSSEGAETKPASTTEV